MLEILKIFDITILDIQKAKIMWNIDIVNFKHVIDKDGMNHVLSRHGEKSGEVKENIIKNIDIGLIQEIVKSPDELASGGLSGTRKLPTLMYIKNINSYKYYYVVEILKNKKQLRIKTLFKNKIKLKNKIKTK